MTETLFIVQPYQSKPHRLVALPAQIFDDEASARRAAHRLARFRAGIVVLSQEVDPLTWKRALPFALAIHGQVPDDWKAVRAA